MALPTTVRDDALGLSTDLAQAGAVFNDATRLADGGLWSSPADNNNQPAYLGMYTTDINAVSDDIAAILANPAATTIGGVAYAPSTTDVAALTEIESQLQTLLANCSQRRRKLACRGARAAERACVADRNTQRDQRRSGAVLGAQQRAISDRHRRQQCRIRGSSRRR